jgi:transcriptional regulator GlxA family with amidase domain
MHWLIALGVSAGIDATLAFLECHFGTELVTYISDQMEYERHTNPRWDPFAAVFNVTSA